MIDGWISDIREKRPPGSLGMILVHNGVVRATAKDGSPVKGMRLSFDRELLARAVAAAREKEGIADVRAWINEGDLKVGDDIMKVVVAGRFRTDVLPVLVSLLTVIKGEIVREEEVR
jgi:molybdopterin synthase catalytic subunit